MTALMGCEASGRERLERLPEADLYYPGSETLADGGNDRTQGISGFTQAGRWVILGTDETLEEVHAFYQTELAERGWEEGPRSRSTSEIAGYTWDHGGTQLRLSFKDTEQWYQRLEGSDQFATLYEVRLVEMVEP